MKKAVEEIDHNNLSLQIVATKYEIKYFTLRRYYMKYKKDP